MTLVDRGEPGDETSFGHAGIISRGSVLPPNGPAIWRSIGQYASNRHPAVRYHMGFIARASLPMFLIMCVAVFLLVSFPNIATFLPSAMK